MNISIFIARRIGLKSTDNGDRTSSPGVIVGYVGVALAIVIMLLAIAVVSGFKKEITEKLLGFNAPVTIFAPEDANHPSFTSGITLNEPVTSIISDVAPSAQASLILRQPAIFKTDSDFQGIVLKGIQSGNQSWEFYEENLVEGTTPTDDDPNTVMISATTASRLGIKSGDKLLTHFLENDKVRTRNLTVTGIFDTHFHDFDNAIAVTPIEMLQQLTHADSLTGTAIELNGIGVRDADIIAHELHNRFIAETAGSGEIPLGAYKIQSINESCGQYLNWLDLLDTNVVVIIILMAFVSGFTLISSLFIIILERVNTIGMLKAIGATNGQIRRIFIYIAERLVIGGMIAGNIIAIAIAWAQTRWHILPLDPEAYYLNFVPVNLTVTDILIVDISVIIISALVLILPSHIISRLSPASTLRYE